MQRTNGSPKSHHGALALLFTVAAVVGLTGCFDNMFPTANFENGRSSCYSPVSMCMTDNASVAFWVDPIMPAYIRTGTRAAMTDLGGSTDLTAVEQADRILDAENNAETDLLYYVDNYLPDFRVAESYFEDSDFPASGRCDQAVVRFHHDRILQLFPWEQATHPDTYQSIACHESGHMVGLVHGRESDPIQDDSNPVLGCMRDGVSDPMTTLGSHNVTSINSAY